MPDNGLLVSDFPMSPPHDKPAFQPAAAPLAAARTLEALQAQHPCGQDLWVFGYASLIWRPEFEAIESHLTRVQGWHRALKMWSRINRGTPGCPGLVFALLRGGSCQGVAYRVHADQAHEVLARLWAREMPMTVYEPRWLPCPTPSGRVRALAFTLPNGSPSHTGTLEPMRYQEIFARATGRFGSTHDYAVQTLEALRAHGIEDRALSRLIQLATGRIH